MQDLNKSSSSPLIPPPFPLAGSAADTTNSLPREAVGAPSLAALKARLDGALSSLV